MESTYITPSLSDYNQAETALLENFESGSKKHFNALYYNALIWCWDIDSKFSGRAVPGWFRIDKNGRICDINFTEMLPDCLDSSNAFDVHQQLVLPGLHDSHIHIEMLGESLFFVDLKNCYSIKEMQTKVKDHLLKNGEISWIIGVNWDQTKLSRYPNRSDIDEISQEKPIFLWRACWHIGVANTKALDLAGVFSNDFDVSILGGVVEVNESGPTGILKERAVELVTKIISNKTNEEKSRFIKCGMDMCKKFGLTSVQTNDENAYEIYKELQLANQLPLRIFLTPMFSDLNQPNPNLPSEVNQMGLGLDAIKYESRLIVNRVKIFSDGSLGAETAALTSSDNSYTGILINKFPELCDMIQKCYSNGYRVEIHAIGDAAAEQVIKAISHVIQNSSHIQTRPILTHCQVLREDLIEHMDRMGMVANIQPSFVPTDMRWVKDRLSDRQQEYAYAWKSLMYRNIIVAGGSDAPIETCSPFVGMYDAIMRKSREKNTSGYGDDDDYEVYKPDECLTFSEALWIYTVGSALAANCENDLGSIANGYAADFLVVDPRVINDPSILNNLVPDMVCVGGLPTYVNPKNGIFSKYIPLEQKEKEKEKNPDNHHLLKGIFVPGKNGQKNKSWRTIQGTFIGSDYGCSCCNLWK